MSDHNTLDDLVRVASAHVPRCEVTGCGAPATHFVFDNTAVLDMCDGCSETEQAGGAVYLAEHIAAPAIRRLVASGVLR